MSCINTSEPVWRLCYLQMIRETLVWDVRGAQHTAFDAFASVGNEHAGAFRTLAEFASPSPYFGGLSS